jgi:hypothetical protein
MVLAFWIQAEVKGTRSIKIWARVESKGPKGTAFFFFGSEYVRIGNLDH